VVAAAALADAQIALVKAPVATAAITAAAAALAVIQASIPYQLELARKASL